MNKILSGPLWLKSVVPVRVLFMGQKDLITHLLWIIVIISDLKPYSCVEIIYII